MSSYINHFKKTAEQNAKDLQDIPSNWEEMQTADIDEMEQVKLEQIKQDKIKNEKSDEPYKPKEREWITSGPFQIDRSEYALGEKIFVNMSPQAENIKGNIIFAKKINMTHAQEYMKLNYDSSSGQEKFYFKIVPDKILGFCTSEEVVGDWRVFFPETNYNTLSFKIKNQFVPGTEGDFDPVC